jgi:hypothetical protein
VNIAAEDEVLYHFFFCPDCAWGCECPPIIVAVSFCEVAMMENHVKALEMDSMIRKVIHQ